MFTVTEKAASELAGRLANRTPAQPRAFTFAREDHGWRLKMSQGLEGEVIIRHLDKVVLVLDSEAALKLSDRTLELNETGTRPRLRMPQSDRASA